MYFLSINRVRQEADPAFIGRLVEAHVHWTNFFVATARQLKTAALLFLPLLVVASIGHSQTTPEARSYLGQNPSGTTPVIFAPGIISKGNIHSRLEISPDGQEMFWNTVDMKTFSTQIVSVKNVSGK